MSKYSSNSSRDFTSRWCKVPCVCGCYHSHVLVLIMLLCCSRPVGCCEQRWSRSAVWSHRLAHYRGLQVHASCQSVWRHRRNTERPPSHQDGQRQSGQRGQRVWADHPIRWTLLRVQVRSGVLQWQSAVRGDVTSSCCAHTVILTSGVLTYSCSLCVSVWTWHPLESRWHALSRASSKLMWLTQRSWKITWGSSGTDYLRMWRTNMDLISWHHVS